MPTKLDSWVASRVTHSCSRGVSCEGNLWWPPRPWLWTGNQTTKTRCCSPCWEDFPVQWLLNWGEYTWNTNQTPPPVKTLPFVTLWRCLCWKSSAHHSCDMVMKRAASWPATIMQVCRKMLPKTGRASRLAGGLQACSSWLGPPRPIGMASDVIRKMSTKRNCRSAKLVFNCTQSQGPIT